MRSPELKIGWLAPMGPLIVSLVIGIVPAFGLYLIGSIAIGGAPVWWLFPVGWVIFTYSAYVKETPFERVESGLFWLAILAFLAPIVILGVSIVSMSEPVGVFERAGVTLGGTIMFFFTWLVAWFVGLVLYQISQRLEGRNRY